jgi:hypothetical protein
MLKLGKLIRSNVQPLYLSYGKPQNSKNGKPADSNAGATQARQCGNAVIAKSRSTRTPKVCGKPQQHKHGNVQTRQNGRAQKRHNGKPQIR